MARQCWSHEPRLAYKDVLVAGLQACANLMRKNPAFSPTSVAEQLVGVQPVPDSAFRAAHTLMRFKEKDDKASLVPK